MDIVNSSCSALFYGVKNLTSHQLGTLCNGFHARDIIYNEILGALNLTVAMRPNIPAVDSIVWSSIFDQPVLQGSVELPLQHIIEE